MFSVEGYIDVRVSHKLKMRKVVIYCFVRYTQQRRSEVECKQEYS